MSRDHAQRFNRSRCRPIRYCSRYAGFRTLDSIVRTRKVFDTNISLLSPNVSTVSGHYLLRCIGDSGSVLCRTVTERYAVSTFREFAARFGALADLYIFKRERVF